MYICEVCKPGTPTATEVPSFELGHTHVQDICTLQVHMAHTCTIHTNFPTVMNTFIITFHTYFLETHCNNTVPNLTL